MRKNLFLVSGLLAATLFTACNNEEITMPQVDNEAGQVETEAGQELVIALADGSLNMGRSSNAFARAAAAAGDAGAINTFGRPLYSSMASQYIQNIKVYFVGENGNIARIVDVDKDYWKQSLAYSNGRKLTISLKGDKKLTGGNYTVYAMAYSNDHGYEAFTPVEKSTDATIGTDTKWTDFYATAKAGNDPSEIFAGEASVTATNSDTEVSLKSGNGNALVTLYRQVAGISGYFKNIPANVDGDVPTHLRLVASGKNTQVLFGELATNAGDEADKVNVNHVMNGAVASKSDKTAEYVGGKAKGHVVYEIELDKWFTDGFANADVDGDGFVTTKDVTVGKDQKTAAWTNPNAVVNKHKQDLVQGSVWGGKFVIPFALTSKVPTLQLQLVQKAADGKVSLLKYWNIKVDNAYTTASAAVEAPTGVIVKDAKDESVEVYNIYRNHMYSIGKKNFDYGNAKPTEPVDPDGENPDKPVNPTEPDDNNQPGDLSKGQDLTIHVNSNWEAVHDMEID